MADRLRPLLRWEAGLVLLLIGTIIYGNNASQYFFTSGNVFFILLNVGEVAIMALPLTLIVITGEIDLSVASRSSVGAGRCSVPRSARCC